MGDRTPGLAAEPAEPERLQGRANWRRYVLGPTLLLVAGALALLPFVVASMVAEFRGGQAALYDLGTGEPVGAGDEVDPGGAEYLNVAIVDLDEAAGSATLAVSGNRECEACREKRITFFALDDDASQRRGFAPFATVTVAAGEIAFSETVTLPVRGSPSRYPFDAYELRLGLDLPPPDAVLEGTSASTPATPGSASASVATPAAAGTPGDDDGPSRQVLATLQNQLTRLSMNAPTLVSSLPNAPGRPEPSTVFDLRFVRPPYLPALAVLLVVFVATSSALTLVTQPVDGLLLGVGGLILAIWGVRSVLVPSWLEAVTAVDLALSAVILLVLIGVAVRAALHLNRRADIRLPRLRRRR